MHARRPLLLAALALASLVFSPPGAAQAAPYTVEVWADALFDPTGRLQRLDVPEAAEHPAAFVERVRRQLASAKIPPVNDAQGQPASFQTGIRLSYLVTPSGAEGAQVKLTGMQLGPRPLKRYAAAQPEQLPPDTVLTVRTQCDVGTDGRCSDVRVVDATVTSDVLRRWAVASLQGWTFEPQRVAGQPVPGQVEVTLALDVIDARPADFRDPVRLRGR